MYYINQNKPSIKILFINQENKEEKKALNKEEIINICRPTSEFLFKNCLDKSEKYNEFVEGEHILRFSIPEKIKENEEKAEEYKANLFNSYDVNTNKDYPTLSSAYFDCFFHHYNECIETNKI
jgi:hypothetical protein